MERTYTEVGKEQGYTKKEIDIAISQVKFVAFTPQDLPACQGLCLQAVIKQCNMPFSKISQMELHGIIKNSHGFYALNVRYKNGQVQVYIADDGVNPCVVASDFTAFKNDNFYGDVDKMRDFKILTKEQFLKSYSYLTETEYINTKNLVKH